MTKVTAKSDLLERPMSHRGGIRKSTVDQNRKIRRTSKPGAPTAMDDDNYRSMSSDLEEGQNLGAVSPRGEIKVDYLETSPDKRNTLAPSSQDHQEDRLLSQVP